MSQSSMIRSAWRRLTAGPGEEGLIERGARYGYLVKGVIYAIIGILGVRVALGHPVSEPGSTGALETIVTQPFGQVLLVIVALGLVAYVLWRAIMALTDTEDKGEDPKGIAQRLGYIGSGLAYAGVVFTALQLLLGYTAEASGGGKNAWEDWTYRAMGYPFGEWLVGAFGLIMVGAGVAQFWYGLSGDFENELKQGEMPGWLLRISTFAGKYGYLLRGLIYGMIGVFLVQAAITFNPEEAGGMSETLRWLRGQPYGPWLLGVAGLGLFAYGLFAIVQSRYRYIDAD